MTTANTLINPSKKDWKDILARPTKSLQDIEPVVKEVFKRVEIEKDKALFEFTSRFDEVTLSKLQVSSKEIENSKQALSLELRNAIKTAKSNIEDFHRAQQSERIIVETMPGVMCWQEKKPIEKVGLYIPGGTAPLFSTVLMLALPASIAGCKEIILCSPPDRNGNIPPEILYTANLCGVDKIFKLGGIQAIAAMTFGTETVPAVYKIFGPGNQYVTVAKQLATNFGVAIDMPAGPSELLVVADDSANPSYVAADLLSQAEHGPDSQVILVSSSLQLIVQVEEEIEKQLLALPRKHITKIAISNSKFIYLDKIEDQIQLINEYGPEHFIINTTDPQIFIDGIVNAGSVFIGNFTPESAGDYASGTNHTLPTNGFAKAYSGVNLDSFLKSITYQKIDEKGLRNIGETIEEMAAAEGLQAHKNAVTIRLKDLG